MNTLFDDKDKEQNTNNSNENNQRELVNIEEDQQHKADNDDIKYE